MTVRSVKVGPRRGQQAVVLLEVVLALVLFVAAAAILAATMNTSVDSVERQKLALQADNIASSLLAEIQLGARSVSPSTELVLEPTEIDWKAELILTPAEASLGDTNPPTHVEVVVRHANRNLVRRLSQLMDLSVLPKSGLEDFGSDLP